jgi:hypothetical protein
MSPRYASSLPVRGAAFAYIAFPQKEMETRI